MPADLDPKRFGYLLKGVADPAAADRAAVKRKAFAASDMSDADQDTLIDNVTRLLARAARAGWTVAQVVAAAGEDAEMGLGDELCSTLGQFWKSESDNLRRALAAAATFNGRLAHFTWRIDTMGGGSGGGGFGPYSHAGPLWPSSQTHFPHFSPRLSQCPPCPHTALSSHTKLILKLKRFQSKNQ